MNIKIDKCFCRVCLKEESGSNIYTGNILEKFQFTTLVQVEKNDGLSDIICKKCLARLQIAYDFKKEAIASNRKLRSIISNINKQLQQVIGSNNIVDKTIKIQADGESESYDELEDDMQAMIEDEQEIVYKDEQTIEAEYTDDVKKTTDRDQLVEILGDNNAINIRKTQVISVQEDTNDEPPPRMAVFLINESSVVDEVESGYIIDDYDQSTDRMITDEADEPQYLEDDDNDDQLYEVEEPKVKPLRKAPKIASTTNLENRCDICDKTFSTRTNLTRHKITHEGRKPYVCKICNSGFTQNGSLKSHMFIHTGERPFKCTECSKAFTQGKSLVFHMRRHTGEKPFPCDHCGIKFRQKDGLKRHIAAKHAPERSKNHVCDVCGKILLSKYSLNMHLNRHSAQELADAERLRASTAVINHIPNVIKNEEEKLGGSSTEGDWDELFVCDFCDQAFTQENDLLEHRETHPEAQGE